MRAETVTMTLMSKQLKHKVLTKQEQLDLARRYKLGDKRAGDLLITSNLRYATKIAHGYVSFGLPLEDLIQEATIGMMRALETFDPEKGYNFITYASWWIRALITKFCINNVSVVKFGTTLRERMVFSKLRSTLSKHRQANPELSDDQVLMLAADELSVDYDELVQMEVRLRPGSVQSLNRLLSEDGNGNQTFQDLIEDENQVSADVKLESDEAKSMIRNIVKWVATRPLEVVLMEERMLADDPLTLQAIATRFGISRERVRQIENMLKDRIRNVLSC